MFIKTFLVLQRNLCYRQYISPTHEKYRELLLRAVANMMGKWYVGWGWGLARLHEHYHHGTHQLLDVFYHCGCHKWWLGGGCGLCFGDEKGFNIGFNTKLP